MDFFKLTQALEALIYDFMMWVIFYPYTLWLVVFRPGKMLDYAAREVDRTDEAERFDRGLSPPLFLFLSIIIGWVMAPDISSVVKEMADGVLGKAVAGSSWNMLLVRLITFCAFPLVGALIYEWRTPSGITRQSFRKPFFQQSYLCGPFALIFSLGFVIVGSENDPSRLTVTALFMLVCLAWFLWAQSIFFRRSMGASLLASVGWAALSILIGGLVYSLSFLLM